MQDLAALTSDLVAIDSTNPDLVPGGAGEAEIARFVADWLRRAGLDVAMDEAAPGRPNVTAVARGAGGGRTLLLNAHLDTVGAGAMRDPFSPRVEDGRLYGRGAFDMKTSLAAIMLVGAEAVGRGWRGDLIVSAVVDEEYASVGIQRLADTVRADAAVVTEPTGLELCVAHKGFVWLEVVTRGVAAHGSQPEAGVDAIAAMGPVLTGLRDLGRSLAAGESHPLLGTGSIHASLISGGQELSTYPDRCALAIERRTIPGESADLVTEQMRAILDEAAADDPTFDAALSTTLVREPFSIAQDHPFVALARGEAAGVVGREPPLAGAFGWMDSAFLAAAGIPTVIFGPDGDGAHAEFEWADLASAEQTRRALFAIAEAFCG